MLERLPTRAEREPVVGAGEGGDETTAIDKAAEDVDPRARSRAAGARSSRRRSAARRRGDAARRHRPDRRLAEREARHPVLLRSRSRSPTARRWATSHFGYVYDFGSRRGVDGAPRRRRVAERRAARRVRPKDEIEILVLRGDADGSRRRATRRRSPGSRTGCGSWARSRSRSAISPPAASTRVCSLKPTRSVDIAAGAAPLPRARPRDRAVRRRGAVRRGAARPRGAFARSPQRERTSCARSSHTPCPHRLLRLELRALAQRRLLSAAPAGGALARALRRALRHGRGERDLLPAAAPRRGRALGRADAATASSSRSRRRATSRTSSGCASSGRGSSASSSGSSRCSASPKLGPLLWQLPPTFQRDDERLAAALAQLPRELRHCFEFRAPVVVRPEDVYALLREHGVALVIGDRPEVTRSRRTS